MSSRELRASLTLTADGGNFIALIKSAKKAMDDFGSSAGQTGKASRRLNNAIERTALSTLKAGNAFLRAHGQHLKCLSGFAVSADTFIAFASQSSKVFKAYKALQIANTHTGTYQAATAAYSSLVRIPYVGSVLAVGAASAAVALGFKQVEATRSQEPPQSAFRQGGIVEGAQFFGFDRERRLGLAGEAGPEAIIPLRRTSGGGLGIQVIGAGDGRGNRVTHNAPPVVQETVPDGSDGQVISEQAGAQILDMIDAYIIEEQRPGGRLNLR